MALLDTHRADMYAHEHLFSPARRLDVLGNSSRKFTAFHCLLHDLWLTHSSGAAYFAEVIESSAGRRHTYMTSSKYGICIMHLDLGRATPNSAVVKLPMEP